ncbi:DUF4334 domain-containing protein [Modestobacter sp. I12A-02662]|uniref:DUF4334 domain-containing protein n=1 Tax=Modestobacter sp. I12A-02662 TaxID=1730496 RepID=UPI0034DF6C64
MTGHDATAGPRPPDDGPAARRLQELRTGAPDAATVLAWFDELPAVGLADLTGRWRGSELPSGHPLDGLLTAYGWYGKEVVDPETVHPLLWQRAGGPPGPISLDLVPVPLLRDYAHLARNPLARAAFAALRPLLGTGSPRARARLVEHRGVLTAALVYDRLPVIDVFRRVTADTLLGEMDLRGQPAPYFFTLHRAPAAG